LRATELLDPEATGLDPRQAAAGLADPTRDPLRELHVARLEIDVVGDQERPSPDRDRARRGMQAPRSEVRLSSGLADRLLQPLVLSASDVGELDPVGPGGSLRVQVDRQLVALGDL